MWQYTSDGSVIDYSPVLNQETGEYEYPNEDKTFKIKVNVYANGDKVNNEKVVTANSVGIDNVEIISGVIAERNEDSSKDYDYYTEVAAGTSEIEVNINDEYNKIISQIKTFDRVGYRKAVDALTYIRNLEDLFDMIKGNVICVNFYWTKDHKKNMEVLRNICVD